MYNILLAAVNHRTTAEAFICERGEYIYFYERDRKGIRARREDNYPAEKILGAVNASRAAVVKGKPGASLSHYSYVRHPNRAGLPVCLREL